MITSWIASHWIWLIGAALIAACVLQPALMWRFRWQALLLAACTFALMQWAAATSLRGELAARELAMAQAAQKAESHARATERAHALEMAAIDYQLTQENEHALAEKDALIACLRDGSCRVRDRFTCPRVPGPPASPGGGDGAAEAGLRREDAEFLVRESERADAAVRQLTACQAVIASDRAQQKP